MRAAFVAVSAGKQVPVLMPTTLLAQQHCQNLADRFADWPIRVESLSRFHSCKRIPGAETPADLEDLRVEMIDRFGLLP